MRFVNITGMSLGSGIILNRSGSSVWMSDGAGPSQSFVGVSPGAITAALVMSQGFRFARTHQKLWRGPSTYCCTVTSCLVATLAALMRLLPLPMDGNN